MSIATILFTVTLFDVMYGFKKLINPGISQIYNALGTQIEPNMVTLVVFDWRGYDTLGEALILVSAVVIVLLVFGRGKVKYNEASGSTASSSEIDNANEEFNKNFNKELNGGFKFNNSTNSNNFNNEYNDSNKSNFKEEDQ
jgi:energy-converting hydrogenase B subunit H